MKHLDAIEDNSPNRFPVDVYHASNAFPLEPLEETLRHGIVAAVAAPTHAGDPIVRYKEAITKRADIPVMTIATRAIANPALMRKIRDPLAAICRGGT